MCSSMDQINIKCVCVFVILLMCVEEGCSWLFPVGEWQIRRERSVSQRVTVGVR